MTGLTSRLMILTSQINQNKSNKFIKQKKGNINNIEQTKQRETLKTKNRQEKL